MPVLIFRHGSKDAVSHTSWSQKVDTFVVIVDFFCSHLTAFSPSLCLAWLGSARLGSARLDSLHALQSLAQRGGTYVFTSKHAFVALSDCCWRYVRVQGTASPTVVVRSGRGRSIQKCLIGHIESEDASDCYLGHAPRRA